jgi:hypothetical protein
MTTQSIKWFWYASPQTFFPLAGKIACLPSSFR